MVAVSRRRAAVPAVLLGVAGALASAAPARAADVFVEVSPSTVQAGYLVGIRASCPDNSQAATVESPAFGMVTAQPQQGVLTAAAMVPQGTDAGTYRVMLNCPDGREATTTLTVTAAGQPSRGPATGFGGGAGAGMDSLLVPGGLGITVAGLVVGLVAARRRRPRTIHGGARR